MTWKHELQLRDIAIDQPLEVQCRSCGHGRHEWPEELLQNPEWAHLYLDEVEERLKCAKRGCKGKVRLSLAKPGDTEAFIGGMA